MNFLGRATNIDSFLKVYKASETKRFCPCEWLDDPDKLRNKALSSGITFFSKLRYCKLVEIEYSKYVNLRKNGMSTEQACVKLKLSRPP